MLLNWVLLGSISKISQFTSFQLSDTRDGDGLQIVQDTGTGGSWPVSTDRVTWIRGAMAVLKYTDHPKTPRSNNQSNCNTAEIDRKYVFDSMDGLYYGETSFWTGENKPIPNG